MSRRIDALFALVALLVSATAFAAPRATSASPSSGPAAGGTEVTIRGTRFATCPNCSPPFPPEVLFGTTPARSVRLVDETTIIAVTPPHREGTVDITVVQIDGETMLPRAFTFSGDFLSGLERVMIPVFSPSVRGQLGSDFRTTVAVSHHGVGGRALLFGHDFSCLILAPITRRQDARVMEPDGLMYDLTPDCATWPAKFFYVTKEHAETITFNARVRDVSRADLSHGTEIPVVRRSDFSDHIVLLNVPIDARFRNTLRVYADPAGAPPVTIRVGTREHQVQLQPGRDIYEPAYAVFTDFPTRAEIAPATTVRVEIRATPTGISTPAPIPLWAFISVTNNATQEITTITPD